MICCSVKDVSAPRASVEVTGTDGIISNESSANFDEDVRLMIIFKLVSSFMSTVAGTQYLVHIKVYERAEIYRAINFIASVLLQ